MISYIALLGFLVFICILYRYIDKYIILISYLIFTYIWMIISSVYIENTGIYLIQTGKFGSDTGASFRLVLLLSIMFISFFIYIQMSDKRFKYNNNRNRNYSKSRVWLNLSIVASGYCFIGAILGRSLPFSKQIDGILICFSFLLGLILYDNRIRSKQRRYCLIYIYIFLFLTIGSRVLRNITFTANFLLLISMAIPFLINLRASKIKIFTIKNLVIISIVFSFLVGIKINSFTGSEYSGVVNDNSAVSKFLYRALALQGEVWFNIDDISYNQDIDYIRLNNEILSLSGGEDIYNAGIYSIMKQIKLSYSQDDKYTLNCGYPAIVMNIFGFGIETIFIMIINGLILGIICAKLMQVIYYRNYKKIFFLYGILSSVFTAFIMGGLYYFTTKLMYFCIIGYFFASLKIHKGRLILKI